MYCPIYGSDFAEQPLTARERLLDPAIVERVYSKWYFARIEQSNLGIDQDIEVQAGYNYCLAGFNISVDPAAGGDVFNIPKIELSAIPLGKRTIPAGVPVDLVASPGQGQNGPAGSPAGTGGRRGLAAFMGRAAVRRLYHRKGALTFKITQGGTTTDTVIRVLIIGHNAQAGGE